MIHAAAIVLIWGYVLAFLFLTARTARRSGKNVWLFSKGRKRQALPAVLFRAAFIFGCALPLLSALSDPEWPAGLITPPRASTMVSVIGLTLMTLGAALALYAQWYMGNSCGIGAADGMQGRIVSAGPFAYTRNPVFVGQIALFAGLAIVYPTILQTVVALGVVAAACLQIRIEDRVLERDVQSDYADYRAKVRRWL